ncbi:PilZ domain-containing protein [Sphingosinicella sp. LHD-64]|uniref:PilZ domain-containing protein n=1 Tax=Sphingosinicella sp. LHD-64 TaxID=3072139 RepID=UPI0028100B91|nr:PilZ domain-containing protein [Sphingosinicella sp. LHD-64]MDQ8756295.1 PilZ domain-containing protein [Sphingosinicella sp. LHD-64]
MNPGEKNGPPPPEGSTPPLSGELSIQVSVSDPDQTERKSSRIPVDFSAGLRQRGGAAPVSVQILDLSTHGFRIDSLLDLSVGTDVWLRLPGLEPCHAKVAWTEGYLAGCAFERPLHPAVLDMIVSRIKG